MQKLVLASHNPGKVNEIQSLLADFPVDIVPQSHWSISDVPETGLTFVENAIIKARHVCHHTQLPAIADDSGLEVASLKGKPGIYSARFAGETASDSDNIAKLLGVMHNIPQSERQACYRCVIVLLRHESDPMPVICQGSWQGEITTAPVGEYGFGYDPVFYDAAQGCTAAQMIPELKNKLSHRAIALQALQKFVMKFEE